MRTVLGNQLHPFDFRLSRQAKEIIEQAAALTGQSLSEFAVATLVETAHQIVDADRLRALSERDARTFVRVLDSGRPNQALRKAAKWYKQHYGAAVED